MAKKTVYTPESTPAATALAVAEPTATDVSAFFQNFEAAVETKVTTADITNIIVADRRRTITAKRDAYLDRAAALREEAAGLQDKFNAGLAALTLPRLQAKADRQAKALTEVSPKVTVEWATPQYFSCVDPVSKAVTEHVRFRAVVAAARAEEDDPNLPLEAQVKIPLVDQTPLPADLAALRQEVADKIAEADAATAAAGAAAAELGAGRTSEYREDVSGALAELMLGRTAPGKDVLSSLLARTRAGIEATVEKIDAKARPKLTGKKK